MNKAEMVQRLIQYLLADMPEYAASAGKFSDDQAPQRILLRSLMNVRYPGRALPMDFYALQDALLSAETKEKNVATPGDIREY